MKQVVLTVGMQGAGKSTFCEKVISQHSQVIIVSRDEILIELFGDAYLSPYTGGHFEGLDEMWKRIAQHLQAPDITIILDCWNGFAEERQIITERLASLGVDRIGAWYFITPLEENTEWFVAKRKARKGEKYATWQEASDRGCAEHDYELFHQQPVETSQGFHFIVKINPLDPLPSFETLFPQSVM